MNQDNIQKINNTIRKLKLLSYTNPKSLKYISRFKHKQMQFLVSKIFLLFESSLSINELIKIEYELLEKNFLKDMYVDIFMKNRFTFKKEFINCKWESFAKFLFYIFQTSTYFFDKKHKVPNVFIIGGEITINEEKRRLFNEFAESLEKVSINFNFYIKQILKWVK
ncbi:hypothetical protein [Mycoplasma miroungirhinis]|uniref:Uncharacterized protein n=1 Tax=Mycoplasma miroungirhinis TaxID=754516 RepID=A0A6M4JCG5_9MOLU|nr:hypothetical protein [Mycoplasma miroungirhinis]QJR43958.1 hypothetical protein HLA92_00650 [Mycoplasma miroungirhinis]